MTECYGTAQLQGNEHLCVTCVGLVYKLQATYR